MNDLRVWSHNKHPTVTQRPAGRTSLRRGQHGFTLVELLVVIAIISVIAGFLIPTLISSRAEADKVACQSNLREIAKSGMLYADQGNNRFFPFARSGSAAHESLQKLADFFDNIKPGMFICRSWRGEAALPDEDGKFLLDEESCSYTWPNQRLAPTDSRPLSSDKYIKSEDQLSGHEKGMNVVDTAASVEFVLKEQLGDEDLPKGLVR